MDSVTAVQALVVPADPTRKPHLSLLHTTPLRAQGQSAAEAEVYKAGRVPHPEILMEYAQHDLGPGCWRYQLLEALDGMKKKFDCPYIIFFPVVSRDNLPFPINQFAQKQLGYRFQEPRAWRGNLVIVKYANPDYTQMMNISMADFPLVKNYLTYNGCHIRVKVSAADDACFRALDNGDDNVDGTQDYVYCQTTGEDDVRCQTTQRDKLKRQGRGTPSFKCKTKLPVCDLRQTGWYATASTIDGAQVRDTKA
ncbi:hypothetical protein EIP86_000261 [Pleurotus ostreatoroseus]|nr:hypothetical protein EIP86_000261 [Pleurotus ostreatoroseus]